MSEECQCEMCRMSAEHTEERCKPPAVLKCSHPLHGSGEKYACVNMDCAVHGPRNRAARWVAGDNAALTAKEPDEGGSS